MSDGLERLKNITRELSHEQKKAVEFHLNLAQKKIDELEEEKKDMNREFREKIAAADLVRKGLIKINAENRFPSYERVTVKRYVSEDTGKKTVQFLNTDTGQIFLDTEDCDGKLFDVDDRPETAAYLDVDFTLILHGDGIANANQPEEKESAE